MQMRKRKKIYEVTDVGKGLMRHEITRLKELHANAVKHGGNSNDFKKVETVLELRRGKDGTVAFTNGGKRKPIDECKSNDPKVFIQEGAREEVEYQITYDKSKSELPRVLQESGWESTVTEGNWQFIKNEEKEVRAYPAVTTY